MFRPYKNGNSIGKPRCGTITSDPQINKFKTENENTVFELTGKKTGKTITCVAWGTHLVEKDEIITVWGYEKIYNDKNVFIVNKVIRNYEMSE